MRIVRERRGGEKMSYLVMTPCGNCEKRKNGTCTDPVDLQEAINKIHSKTGEMGHKGAGCISLMCCRLEVVNP